MVEKILVTGISGFIAKHVAREFLEAGYSVRGTIRSKNHGQQVRDTLRPFGADRLELVEADLLSDNGWAEAVSGCDGVAHLASPFPGAPPKNENELIGPAVEGTLRVLKAAQQAGVPRFVQTSSVAAISAGHAPSKTQFNEDDWSVSDSSTITSYSKSKTLAERAAREFVANAGGSMHYSTVNPGLVIGPGLDTRIGTSLDIYKQVLEGKYPAFPRLYFAIVDVRDVAKAHRLALFTTEPSGGRYVASAGCAWLSETGTMLKKGLGDQARKVPTRDLPNFLARLVGMFDPAVRDLVPELGVRRELDNSRTRAALGMQFIPIEESVIATGRFLIDNGLIGRK